MGNRHLSNGVYLTEQMAAVRIEDRWHQVQSFSWTIPATSPPIQRGIPIVVGVVSPPYTTLTQQDADAFQKPPAGFENWEIRLSDDQSQVLLAPVLRTQIIPSPSKAMTAGAVQKACHIPPAADCHVR